MNSSAATRGARSRQAIRIGPGLGLGLSLGFGLGLGLACAASGRAQEPAADTESVGDTVFVRIALIDVVVADRAGRVVEDLEADDFVLKVDGRVVPIVHFEPASPNTREPAGGESDSDRLPSATSATPGVRSEAPTLVLYLDDDNTPNHLRSRVLEDLLASLDELAPRVVVAQRLRGLRFSPPLTSLADVRDHVAGLGEPSAKALADSRGRSRTTQELATSHELCLLAGCEPCEDNWGELMAIARHHAVAEERRTAETVGALAEVVSAVSGLDGRKVLVWVSAGIPHRPAIEAFAYVGELCGAYRSDAETETMREILSYDESGRLHQVAAHANSHRVTVIAVDAAGLRAGLSAAVDFATAEIRPSMRNDNISSANLQSSLGIVARGTGGRAITDDNRPGAAVTTAVGQASNGYLLGFSLEGPPSGREHRVAVELAGGRRRGVVVRHRESVRDKTLEERLFDELMATLYLGETDNPLGATVEVREGTVELGRRFWEIPIGIRVPVEGLRSLTAEGSRSLRVWLTAHGDGGWRSKTRQELFATSPGEGKIEGKIAGNVEGNVEGDIEGDIEGNVEGDAEGGSDGELELVVRMELPEGENRIAVGIREEITGVTSRLVLEANVPP
jgi:VWFA-related protein